MAFDRDVVRLDARHLDHQGVGLVALMDIDPGRPREIGCGCPVRVAGESAPGLEGPCPKRIESSQGIVSQDRTGCVGSSFHVGLPFFVFSSRYRSCV